MIIKRVFSWCHADLFEHVVANNISYNGSVSVLLLLKPCDGDQSCQLVYVIFSFSIA